MGIEVVELYGRPLPEAVAPALRERLARAYCPFRRYHCDQVDPAAEGERAGRPHGVCLVRDTEAEGGPVPVCPSRMIAGAAVVEDARRLLLKCGAGCELYLLPGVRIPDGGLVDYLLVAVREGLPLDFIGLDLYPVKANGSVWPWREAALSGLGLPPEEGGGARAEAVVSPPVELDWRGSARELLRALHHKLGFFERLGKRLVVAAPESLVTFMMEEFSFDMVTRGHGRESLRLHAYAFDGPDGTEEGTGLRLTARVMLDSVQVAMALGLQASVHEELSAVLMQLSGRLTPENRWHEPAGVADAEAPDAGAAD